MRSLTSARIALLFLVGVANNLRIAESAKFADTDGGDAGRSPSLTSDESGPLTGGTTETTAEVDKCKVQLTRVMLKDVSGVIRHPDDRYGIGRFTVTSPRHTDRVVFYIYEQQDDASFQIDKKTILPGMKDLIISKKSTVEINFNVDSVARISIFFRILNVGEFGDGDDVLKLLCEGKEGRCPNHRRPIFARHPDGVFRPPVHKFLLTFPTNFMGEHGNTVRHHIELSGDNRTLAVVEIDPKRIDVVNGDTLHINPCIYNETGYILDGSIFSISSTKGEERRPLERRIIRFYGDATWDLCVTFRGGVNKYSRSEWILPTQLVRLDVCDGISDTVFVPKRSEPGVHLLRWHENPAIINTTSRFHCRIGALNLSASQGDWFQLGKSENLNAEHGIVSLVGTLDHEDQQTISLKSTTLFLLAQQRLKWNYRTDSTANRGVLEPSSPSDYCHNLTSVDETQEIAVNVTCIQAGDKVKIDSDVRFWKEAVIFCVNVNFTYLCGSDVSKEQCKSGSYKAVQKWTAVKECLRNVIFFAAMNRTDISRPQSPNQVRFPDENPVVFEHDDVIKVRLMVAVTDHPLGLDDNALLDRGRMEDILKDVRISHFWDICNKSESDFQIADDCSNEVPLVRNLLLYGLMILSFSVLFLAIWRYQISYDLKRRKRKPSETAPKIGIQATNEQHDNEGFTTAENITSLATINSTPQAGWTTQTLLTVSSSHTTDQSLPLDVPGGLGTRSRKNYPVGGAVPDVYYPLETYRKTSSAI